MNNKINYSRKKYIWEKYTCYVNLRRYIWYSSPSFDKITAYSDGKWNETFDENKIFEYIDTLLKEMASLKELGSHSYITIK